MVEEQRMKLLSAPYSPYARTVRVVAHELDLVHLIDVVDGDTWQVPVDVVDANPLGKVPTLLTSEGRIIYDSRTICDYLRAISPGKSLLPATIAERSEVLTLQSLGIGLMDVMIGRFLERWRPENKQMSEMAERLRDASIRVCDWLDRRAPKLGKEANLGTIAIACALSYISFRFPEDDWSLSRKQLRRWYTAFSERPSMKANELHDPVTA